MGNLSPLSVWCTRAWHLRAWPGVITSKPASLSFALGPDLAIPASRPGASALVHPAIAPYPHTCALTAAIAGSSSTGTLAMPGLVMPVGGGPFAPPPRALKDLLSADPLLYSLRSNGTIFIENISNIHISNKLIMKMYLMIYLIRLIMYYIIINIFLYIYIQNLKLFDFLGSKNDIYFGVEYFFLHYYVYFATEFS
jgi:hypothetical protein